MKFLRTNVFIALAVSFLVLVSTSCKKEGDTIVQGDTTFFSFYVNYSEYLPGKLTVNFVTNNMSVVPEVKVNNLKLTILNIDESISLSGIIDSAQTVNFSVTADGKTTTGQVTVPKVASVLSVNNIVPKDGSVSLDQASKYTLKWSNSGASAYRIYGYNYSKDIEVESYISATSYDADFRYGYLYVYSMNGFNFATETRPNVKGDYGNGYAVAVSQGVSSRISLRESVSASKSAPIANEATTSPVFDDLKKLISK